MRTMILLAATLVALPGCSSSSTAPTSPSSPPAQTGTAATIRLTAAPRSNGQIDVTATVTNGQGQSVPGAVIEFSTGPNGLVVPGSVIADAAGTGRAVATGAGALTITAIAGGVSQSTTIAATLPDLSASLTVSQAITARPTTFAVTLAGQVAGAPVISYAWSFGDGQSQTTTVASVLHTYPKAGNYAAAVTVTDGLHRHATAALTIAVADPPPPPPPPPSLSPTITCTPAAHGLSTPCSVTALYNGIGVTAGISKVVWSWGDGSIQTVLNSALASNTFAQPGTYQVSVTVTASTVDGVLTATTSTSIVVP